MKKRRNTAGFLPVALFAMIFIVGLGIHYVWFFGTAESLVGLDEVAFHEPYIHFEPGNETHQNRVEREIALFHDSSPLFIPTEWNYLSQPEYESYSLPENSPLFNSFSARYLIEETDYEEIKLIDGNPQLKPGDMLTSHTWAYFPGFGEQERAVEPLRERAAAYSIHHAFGGETVKSGVLEMDSLPNPEGEEWSPVELLIVVDELGLAGRPFSLANSGNEEMDRHLDEWVRNAGWWRELEPGYYRMVIGP